MFQPVRLAFVIALVVASPLLAAAANSTGDTAPLFLNAACAKAPVSATAGGGEALPELTADSLEASSCTAQQNCPGSGCFISCAGTSSCTVGATSVTCDGNTTNCPSCPTPPSNCLDPCCWCECKAAGGTNTGCLRSCCIDCWPPLSCF